MTNRNIPDTFNDISVLMKVINLKLLVPLNILYSIVLQKYKNTLLVLIDIKFSRLASINIITLTDIVH